MAVLLQDVSDCICKHAVEAAEGEDKTLENALLIAHVRQQLSNTLDHLQHTVIPSGSSTCQMQLLQMAKR